MRLAAIDLGTNTVRLLVVDADGPGPWRTLHQAQRITRLGEGLAASGRLGETAMDRTATVVAECAAIAEQFGVERVLIVATSAMRDAANGSAFAARVESSAGHRVRIVPGPDEARLALRGVLNGLDPMPGAIVVFDIGGGSTEFIRARNGRVEASISLRLGVVPLAEYPGPYAEMARHVCDRLDCELPPAIRGDGIDRLVGTAGTITTLAALDQDLAAYDWSRVHRYTLTRQAIERQRARLEPLSVGEIGRLPCLKPGRADLIRPGIAIALGVMDVLGLVSLTVSEFGLREGIMVEALE